MRFWWVNHKQTYKQEVGNGYIWSPKTFSNGRKNHFYETMRKVLPGDIVFSYASGQIRQVGVISRPAASSPRPVEFGTTGQQWDDNGWMVPVDWQTLPTPFIPKNNLAALTPLLPEKYSPFRPKLAAEIKALILLVSRRGLVGMCSAPNLTHGDKIS